MYFFFSVKNDNIFSEHEQLKAASVKFYEKCITISFPKQRVYHSIKGV